MQYLTKGYSFSTLVIVIIHSFCSQNLISSRVECIEEAMSAFPSHLIDLIERAECKISSRIAERQEIQAGTRRILHKYRLVVFTQIKGDNEEYARVDFSPLVILSDLKRLQMSARLKESNNLVHESMADSRHSSPAYLPHRMESGCGNEK